MKWRVSPFVHALLAGLCLAAAPAAAEEPPAIGEPDPDAPSSWQLQASLLASYFRIHPTVPAPIAPPVGTVVALPDRDGAGASSTFEVTHFLDPVVDDGAPRSLQPFLQRTSMVYGIFDAGGSVTHSTFDGTPPGGTDRTDKTFGVGLGVDVYVARWLALVAGAGYAYDVLHDVGIDDATHGLSATGGFALRVADARFDAAYTFSATRTNGSFAPLRWGALRFSALAALARGFSLNVVGQVIDHGGTGGGELGYYAGQDLGFSIGGLAERGRLFAGEAVLANRFTGDAGLSYWVAPRVVFSAEYALTYTLVPDQEAEGMPDGYTQIEQALTISAALRVP